MMKLLRISILAVSVLGAASSAMAANQQLRDYADEYGGYPPNSTEGQRAFWDTQSR